MRTDDAGLSQDPAVWRTRVSVSMTLFQALTVHGHLLLALRHPHAQQPGLLRETIEETIAILSRLLVHAGAMAEDTLRGCFMLETSAGSMTWEDFEAACARLDARVAAMGHVNPDASRLEPGG
jgi:hypothetical protein